MLWTGKFIIIISLWLFEINFQKLSKLKSLLSLLVIFTFPVLLTSSESPERIFVLFFLSGLWLLYRKFNRKIFLAIFILVAVYSSLVFNGLISFDFHWDLERSFWANGHYASKISQIRDRSLFLPYPLRPLVFNWLILPVAVLGSGVTCFWFDKITPITGILAVFPLIYGLLTTKNQSLPTAAFIVVLSGSLSRNPDTSTIYYLLLPQLITLITQGIKKV